MANLTKQHKKMKKLLFIICVSLMTISLSSCFVKVEEAYGKKDSIEYNNVKPFERIDVYGYCIVRYYNDSTYHIKVVKPSKYSFEYKVSEKDGILTINSCRNGNSEKDGHRYTSFGANDFDRVVVDIYSPRLSYVAMNGNGSFWADNVTTDSLITILEGNGTINFCNLQCKKLDAKLSGNGCLSFDKVKSAKTALELGGNGTISGNFTDGGDLLVDLNGNGSISVGGNVNTYQANKSGNCGIYRDDLKVRSEQAK